MRAPSAGGGWKAILYSLRKGREAGGIWRLWKALRSKNACKTCALGMGGQLGGMVNEQGRFPEVCKKSIQAMVADMQGRVHEHFFDDFNLEKLRGFSPRELEHAGRLAEPVYAGPLDSNYRTITWPEAIEKIAAKLRRVEPSQTFWYVSGRSSNEAGFLVQLLTRLYGTNNISNCSYYCHQASGVGLASVTGSGTATVELDDIEQTKLLFVIGGNPASNHPRLLRTMVNLKRRGGKIIVINPLRELGLVRFRVPSDPVSLLLGSTIADEYLQPHIGGDLALLAGLAKSLLERKLELRTFLAAHTEGFEAYERSIAALSWEAIVTTSGIDRTTIERVATMYAEAPSAIFSWTMGITHHAHGTANVQAIAALALLRGMVGRPHAGLLPIRGHSNVQGMGSMGVTPALRTAVLERLESHFGVTLPRTPGLDTLSSLEAAHAGGMRVGIMLGGNLYGASPDATFAGAALGRLDLAVYLNTTLNTGHACGRGRETIILPVLARDEESQVTTQESMFNYVRVSDGGAARFEGPRSEVAILAELAEHVLGSSTPIDWRSMREHQNLRAAIAKIVPGFEALNEVNSSRREFTIPGRLFHDARFATPNGRANMHAITSLGEQRRGDDDALRLMTIRSEGQFNTVVYEEEDVYRGQERRDVILMNARDIERRGLRIDQRVVVRSDAGSLRNVLVRAVDIRAGNAAMYFPEANVLVPRHADAASRTPAFKNVAITVTADEEPVVEATRPEFVGAGASARPKAC